MREIGGAISGGNSYIGCALACIARRHYRESLGLASGKPAGGRTITLRSYWYHPVAHASAC
jgi:hypothetical protein